MRFRVERQSREGVGQWCASTLLQDALASSGMFYDVFGYTGLSQTEFQYFDKVRDDLGQGTGGGTKNLAAAPKAEMNQNENL